MHFSIPDTKEYTENGSSYIGYNIHINGVYHCTVRYKQLHNLHEQLKRKCGSTNLPQFPPKKFLPLTTSQLYDRRAQLEKYIQAIGQESRIITSNILNSFLRNAQQESEGTITEQTTMDIYLMNGYQIQINLLTTDHTNTVLKKVCEQINLPSEYIDYFALFCIRRNDNGDITIVRKFEDFESPYISQKLYENSKQNDVQRIYLRKMCWDPEYDLELMCHPVSLNLLYVQTVSDVERGWIICTKSVLAQLADLQSRGAKKQYLELARTLKYYGYMQFGYAISDYPQPDSRVIIAIGKRELSMRLPSATECNTREGCFKVTRMRCWRITTVRKNDSNDCDSEPQLELSFEYLLSKDKLRWINISSPHAIFMSTCLQSVVDELLLKKNGLSGGVSGASKSFNNIDTKNHSWTYMKRDGSISLIDLNSSADAPENVENTPRSSQQWSEPFSIKKLQEKFSNSALSRFMSGNNQFIENDAFEDIGDEDL